MSPHTANALDPADVQVEIRGPVPSDAADEARERVAAVTSFAHVPVLYARVKLNVSADPAVALRCTAQANIDVNGRIIRGQAVGEHMSQAVHLLVDRLRVRLRRSSRDWEALRGRLPAQVEQEWRGASPPRRPLPCFPRPAGERQIVRHKAYELGWATPDEAAFDMEQLDYDFHLFREVGTGEDSVIYRAGDGYRLAQVTPRPDRLGPVSVPLTVSPVPAPAHTVAEATERLETSDLPFVFFADARTGRGAVVYHRYDGHYGLITPSD
ncbi:sigma 54 modulation/S30EA ribosomal C-terminal domain-containing protein [Microbispora sp. RL4-1S]|uniref:Sigma 54 modulation/S30EA ribosomal C-terminal domain-containing protein n=1 Tax=Microbispora oryzae TaxID=2806554 RepID=A0A940WPD5_9ACTN|nr:sigma 54 modulation/S30EA ribosomal C-terminal domain-containing protein [Microbispora oryzae]MBP2705090.1 sigma 54 modulation/S30EA ribosomal C-terminal domain-containing protein [Microbispora oryzae]